MLIRKEGEKVNQMHKRFIFKGTKEQLPKVEAALKKLGVTRKSMYFVLKYFEINPQAVEILEKEFSDVQQDFL